MMSFTFAGMISELAGKYREAPAFALEGRSWSFGDLQTRGSRLAHVLRTLGVRRADRVGFLGKNSPAFFELTTACSLLDAVVVGLNWRLSSDELTVIIKDANLRIIVASPEQKSLLLDTGDSKSLRVINIGAELDELIASAAAMPVGCESGPESVLFQLYSSGTTGRPKGVLITNANLSFTQLSGRLLYEMDENSVNLVASPLFHIGGAGYALTALSQGGKTVFVHDSKPSTLLRAIQRHRVTHAFLVPTLIQDILRAPELAETDLSSLQIIAYGGAPMSERVLLDGFDKLRCKFLGVYGMTETAGTVISLAAADHDPSGPRARLLRSIGKPLPWAAEVQLREPVSLEPIGADRVGEIWVRSGQVTPGYWRQSEVTAQSLTADGWLRTGDAAYRDKNGYYFLQDRLKDMVITGGENVYPAEIENVIANHPAVLEVAVIGVPSERWGETIKALVIRSSNVTVSEQELIDFARARIAHYKCPTIVEFVDSLPRNASGKVLKHVLRAKYGGVQNVLSH
ncbi:MAG TPA: AMP-binding protein [Steroidobacteraceae bacterium]|jgi:long-chain acyl-CoA synthetase|nr:AMP-binding protein [Steroidobacteraceae bacterium]